MSGAPPVVFLGETDNVAVAARALRAGERIRLADGAQLTLADDIPFGHKLAIRPIAAGGDVVKYDEVIGRATAAIAAGAHVHVHNVVSARLPGALPTYHGGDR
jgi:altronate dehydratase